MNEDSSAPYAGFRGRVGRTFTDSVPDWPDRPRSDGSAPNVVLILADDVGFADLGCYGSEIDTPNLDRLAADGVRFANFHVAPMCSPTRAALLTGTNPHLAGAGHVAHSDPGFPGYAMELAGNVATTAEILRDAGYTTLMVGKWHLCKDADLSEAGQKHSWPVQRGFEHYYGILDGFTNFHQPHRVYEDNHVVEVDGYPDDYYFTDDLTERATRMVKAAKAADPAKPFFLYFAHGSAHAPLQAKAADVEKYRGRYDAGWDVLRAERHARQQALGVVPAGTPLPPRNTEPGHEVCAWDELPAMQQELFARYMECYAAMVDSLDQSVGRLRSVLTELGEWENTLLVFTSDNGGSREGLANGTSAYFRTLLGRGHIADLGSVEEDYERIELMGGPRTLPHYPQGWAMVSNTPFRLYKTNTHAGGHSVPMIVTWPGRVPADPAWRRQYVHAVDVLPTLLELLAVDPPAERHGQPLRPMAGRSFAEVLRRADAPQVRTEQHYELEGNRGFYRDGWEIVSLHLPGKPFGPHEWELYHLDTDPTEVRNLAADHPERVAELAAAWEAAAWENQVFPLDEGSGLRWLQRPDWDAAYEEPVRLLPGTPTLERYRSLKLIQARSFVVLIRLDHGAGDEGVLVAHGDQGGGYACYVEDGRLRFVHNGYGLMSELDAGELGVGEHEVTLDVAAPGGWRWHVDVRVDGEHRGRIEDLRMLIAMAPFEGIDVGIDRRSPVSWDLYERHGPFPYRGTLREVVYEPGELAPDAGPRFLDYLRSLGPMYE